MKNQPVERSSPPPGERNREPILEVLKQVLPARGARARDRVRLRAVGCINMIHVAPVDADLRARNASWGVRDLVDVRRAAAEHRQFERERHTLPANKLVMLLLPARHASLLAELLLPARHPSLLAEFERRSTP